MFERTESGQQNRALFYGVEATCYVEGGGGHDEHSFDAMFWERVIYACRPDLRIKFLPRGGKPILEALANEVVTQDLKGTLVAMDADYDWLTGDIINDPRIMYSYGYSWENDALSPEVLDSVIRTMAHRSSLPSEIRYKIGDAVAAFGASARPAIKADLLAFIAKSSVLPRGAPGRVIKASSGAGLPYIDRKELLKLTSVSNKATRPREKVSASSVPAGVRHLVGHCFAHAMKLLIRAVLREMGIRKASTSEHIQDVAILTLEKSLKSAVDGPLFLHHRSQCVAIP